MKSLSGAAIAAALSAVCLSGCGTITQGTSQNIAITTSPPGAHCEMTRKGEHVATLDKTPGTVKVDKTKNDILLTCNLAGPGGVRQPGKRVRHRHLRQYHPGRRHWLGHRLCLGRRPHISQHRKWPEASGGGDWAAPGGYAGHDSDRGGKAELAARNPPSCGITFHAQEGGRS